MTELAEQQVRRCKIGEVRERLRWAPKGFYPALPKEGPSHAVSKSSGRPLPRACPPTELIEVVSDNAVLVQIEVLAYPFAGPPGWQSKGWREPTSEERATLEAQWGMRRKVKAQQEIHEIDAACAAERRYLKQVTAEQVTAHDVVRAARRLGAVRIRLSHWWYRLWYRLWHPFERHFVLPPARAVKAPTESQV